MLFQYSLKSISVVEGYLFIVVTIGIFEVIMLSKRRALL
jgi:hypothetical protein